MNIELNKWYKYLAPRTTVLVSTSDRQGVSNAAPFSFVMPVSSNPPVIAVAMVATRHTLANIRATGDFVINVPGEDILSQLMICAKPLPQGVSEIKEAGLTEQKSAKVSSPGIKECLAWFECRLRQEIPAGDHLIVLGDIVHAEAKEAAKQQPLLHLGGMDFSLPGKILKAE
jgi:flavin reductase (DIM6/NTAB) family NADH-FMN oxidoreductase RutF